GIIKPRIIIEEFLSEDGSKSPEDYKLYCFNNIKGEHNVGITAVHKNRNSKEKTKSIYNTNWELESEVVFGDRPDLKNIIPKPAKYDEMVECAIKLSKPFPHARVDFYIVNDTIYVGEI